MARRTSFKKNPYLTLFATHSSFAFLIGFGPCPTLMLKCPTSLNLPQGPQIISFTWPLNWFRTAIYGSLGTTKNKNKIKDFLKQSHKGIIQRNKFVETHFPQLVNPNCRESARKIYGPICSKKILAHIQREITTSRTLFFSKDNTVYQQQRVEESVVWKCRFL